MKYVLLCISCVATLPKLLLCHGKDLRGQDILHTLSCEEAAIRRLFGRVTGTTPDLATQDRRVMAHRSGERGIRWPVDGDQWRLHCTGHVHWPAITADQQVSTLEERRKLGQAGLARQVERLLAHARGDFLDQWQIAGGAGQDHMRVLLAYQAVKQRSPVGNRPAFGLSV